MSKLIRNIVYSLWIFALPLLLGLIFTACTQPNLKPTEIPVTPDVSIVLPELEITFMLTDCNFYPSIGGNYSLPIYTDTPIDKLASWIVSHKIFTFGSNCGVDYWLSWYESFEYALLSMSNNYPYFGGIYFTIDENGVVVTHLKLNINLNLIDIKATSLEGEATVTRNKFDQIEIEGKNGSTLHFLNGLLGYRSTNKLIIEKAKYNYLVLKNFKDLLIGGLKIADLWVDSNLDFKEEHDNELPGYIFGQYGKKFQDEEEIKDVRICPSEYNNEDVAKVQQINYDFKNEQLILRTFCPDVIAKSVENIVNKLQIPPELIDIRTPPDLISISTSY